MKIGDFMPSCAMPFFMTLNLMAITPAISMAPQKEISPSPWLKCRSPTLNFAPLTCTGRKVLEPLPSVLMSQLPPCSGLPGIVLAPSLPIFSFTDASAEPAWTLVGLGGSATVRLRCVCVEINSPSRLFQSSRTSGEGAQPRTPGWIRPAKRTPGMCREEQKMPSKSQIALALVVRSVILKTLE